MNCSFLLEISDVYVCFTSYTVDMIPFTCVIIEMKSVLFIGWGFIYVSLLYCWRPRQHIIRCVFVCVCVCVCLPAFVQLTHKHTSEAPRLLTSRAPRLSSSTLSLRSRPRLLIKPRGDFRRTVEEPHTVSPRAETESIKVMNPRPDF